MAAPVGHLLCAIALLNSGAVDVTKKNEFYAGNLYPDIRYILPDIERSITHRSEGDSLRYVLDAPSAFETGRRHHVYVDREREKHMVQNNAYRFIKNGPLKTQMLKIVEDHMLFDRLRGQVDVNAVFSKIYDEERSFSVNDKSILAWHALLSTYLDQSYWFDFVRYYQTLSQFQKAYGMSDQFFGNIWLSVKTLGFFIYAYIQVEKLSKEPELRKIVMDFYDNKFPELIRQNVEQRRPRTVLRMQRSPLKVHA